VPFVCVEPRRFFDAAIATAQGAAAEFVPNLCCDRGHVTAAGGSETSGGDDATGLSRNLRPFL
jgi:hypothetical protein